MCPLSGVLNEMRRGLVSAIAVLLCLLVAVCWSAARNVGLETSAGKSALGWASRMPADRSPRNSRTSDAGLVTGLGTRVET